MKSNNATLLVLGVSRGGTTLSSAALGSHPDIAMLDEDLHGGVFHVTGGKTGGVKLCVPNQAELERRWHWIYTPGVSNGFFRKSLFMNKIPKSPLSIMDYLDHGPCQVVCVLRSAEDVLQSIMKRENKSLKVASYRWQRYIEIFAELKGLNHPHLLSPVYLNFDSLVQAPEQTLKALCAKIDLDFHPNMLEAPQRNDRYKSKGFDASRTKKETKHVDTSLISMRAKELYSELKNIAL